ncbi:SCAN domain-containing protein 3-like [Centruroides vittatus]|uniref:SCAN domain-containing protein 3-like n=1 Tax=Centruroides vittatus TaxID=120091 RepID=UPI003510AD48
MVPSKLKRHLSTKHSSLLNKDVNYFRQLLEQNRKQAAFMTTTVCVSDKVREASYKVAELIVKAKKPHTIAETLLMPVCKEMVKIVLGSEAASEISKIPLSDDTISRRVIEMSSDIEDIMKEKINSSRKFSLQIDESTDISGRAQLLAYIRRSRSYDMTGRVKGSVAQVREINPNIRCDRCLIHREAIVAKSLPPSLKAVLN